MPMHRIAVLVFATAALLSTAAGVSAAPILIVSGGELMGAQNVDVGGTFYDVVFVDGSCIGQFSGCDNASADFAFTGGSALVATLALLDQVFLDGPSGAFDSQPELTHGCSDFAGCQIWVPFFVDTSVGVVVAETAGNSAGGAVDPPLPGNALTNENFFFDDDRVWARFTPAATTVPEPTSLLLLGTGAAALAAKARRRKKQQQ